MMLLLAKLVLTPSMMYFASAAGRRWGPGVSGWLTGLPLLAGPISVFICIEQGPGFAAHAAGSTLLGMWSSCAFCLAYYAARRSGWVVASVAAIAAFTAGTALLHQAHVTPWIGIAGVFVGAALGRWTIRAPTARPVAVAPPRWDMPARLVIAAAFVLVQTGIAGWLGPQLSGLVIPFPIVVILLTAFAHRQFGIDGAVRVLRGFLVGMYAFAAFFLVVALGLEPLGAWLTYTIALAICLIINGAALWGLRQGL
ncbi:MAG TPA: hypothetical protein VF277_09340 [Steroidobacteraceae bacterium]